MLPENETVTFEDQIYLNPQTALDESNTFIDNLRAVQQANNQAINTDLENLGTYPAAQSNLGGLLGGSGYFTSRYQVPQTVALTNDLRVAAQASALNQALQNEQAKWKQRYNKAYKNYQRRARSSGGGSGGDDYATDTPPLGITTNTGSKDKTDVSENPNIGGNNLVQVGPLTYTYEGKTLSPAPTSFMSLSSQGMSLGVWPDGSRMTEGSTYTRGGKTYTYVKADNTRTPNVYQVSPTPIK